MFDLIVENLVNNNKNIYAIKNKINDISIYLETLNKNNNILIFDIVLLAGSVYLIYRKIKLHDDKIKELNKELKEIKSKGE